MYFETDHSGGIPQNPVCFARGSKVGRRLDSAPSTLRRAHTAPHSMARCPSKRVKSERGEARFQIEERETIERYAVRIDVAIVEGAPDDFRDQ